MNAARNNAGSTGVDAAVLRLLGHRYADGLVYFGDDGERAAFERAVRLGLISRDGYVTPEGFAVIAQRPD